MSAVNPTMPAKPSKPYPEYPLFPHGNGQWAKKIRGKLYYFGLWADPDGALTKYQQHKEDLHAGRTPTPDPDTLTLKQLANAFLEHKRAFVDSGELSPRTWTDYKAAADILVEHFGKLKPVAALHAEDFASLRRKLTRNNWGPLRIRDIIQRIRSLFKYGFEAGLIDKPMRFGPGFARPSKKNMRLERARKGPRMFEAEELRRVLDAASLPMRAMILLGINAGFGNADCGTLPLSALDLERGWVNYPRPKTGIERRCPLWPETVAAIREALSRRPEPKDPADAGKVFITSRGGSWHKRGVKSTNGTGYQQLEDNPISKEMRKLLNALGINGHRNFYALRHTFETVGGEAKDQVAVDHIMGHARDDMASVYRERISDERLQAVTDHVRRWLFPPQPNGNQQAPSGLATP